MAENSLKTIEYNISPENPIIYKNPISEKKPELKFSETELVKIREAILKEIGGQPDQKIEKIKLEKTEKPAISPKKQVYPEKSAEKPIVQIKTEVPLIKKPVPAKEKIEKKVIPPEKKSINLERLTKYLAFKKIFFLIFKSLLIALVFLLLITLVGIYLAGWQGDYVKILTRYLPLPAVYVNKTPVSLNDYFSDLAAIENYFQRNNIKVPAQELHSRVMKSLIEKEIISQLAKVSQISVSDKDISDELANSSLKQNTVEQLNSLVQQLYGWDFPTYLEKVIKPLVLINKVETSFNQSSGNIQVYRQLESYRQELLVDPNKFTAIASRTNQDETKSVAGDWGWFELNSLAFELQSVVLNLSVNEISRVIETADNYQIIKLKEKVIDQKDGQPDFYLFHIILKKSSFQKYLDDQIKKAKVVTLIKI